MTLLVRHTDVLQGVVGGFPPIIPFFGWRTYTVAATYTDPAGVELPAFKLTKASGPDTDTFNQIGARVAPYYVHRFWPYGNANIRGSFPGLAWYLMHPTTMALVAGPLLPLGNQLPRGDPKYFATTPVTEHYVQWYDHTTPITGPYLAVQVAREPSDALPLWVSGHPVDIVAHLLTEGGETYDSDSANDVIASLGPELRHVMGVTSLDATRQEVIDDLSAAYGFAIRRSTTTGTLEFVHWLEKLAANPATTLDATDLRAEGGPTFALEEASILNRVHVSGSVVSMWTGPGMVNKTIQVKRKFLGFTTTRYKDKTILVPSEETPASRLMITPADITFSYSTDGVTADADTFGEHETTIALGGMPAVVDRQRGGAHALNLEQWAEGRARLVFDGHSRGRQMAQFSLIREATDRPALGDAVTLDLPHLPSAQLGQSPTSQRIGTSDLGLSRPFRVVARTEEPAGPVLQLADEGTGVQYATAPTITVAIDTTTADMYTVTVTNAAVLTAAGAQVEFQCRVFGPTETPDFTDPGFRLTIDDATTWTEASQPIRFGKFPARHVVFFRARAFLFGGAASSWTSWTGLGTNGGTTLDRLVISNIGSDRATLTWDYLASPAVHMVKVEYRVSGAGSYTIFNTYAAGTETALLTPLSAATSYDVRVVLINPVEFGDVLTGTFTTLGGVIQNLQQTGLQQTTAKFTWDNSNTTDRVIVELRRTGAPVYYTYLDLSPTSNRVLITGLLPNTAYDIRIRLQDPITGADLGDGNTAPGLMMSWTTLSGQTALDPPTNPAVFGAYNPFTGQQDDGLFGLRVFADFDTNPPHDIVFEVAEETAVGSGTPGTYIAQGPTPAVVGGPTWFVGRAANNGKLQYLRAFARVGNGSAGWDDSSKTTALSVNPWPLVPIPPIGGGAHDVKTIETIAIAEDASDTGEITFPDDSVIYRVTSPDQTQFRLRLYRTSASRTSDAARPVTDLNWPADLLLDLSMTSAQSWSVYLAPTITIRLAELGSTVVYWSITNYDPPTQIVRASLFYTAQQATGGTNPVGGSPSGGGSGAPVT